MSSIASTSSNTQPSQSLSIPIISRQDIGIINTQPSTAEMQTVKLKVISTAQFSLDKFAHPQRLCPNAILDDGIGGVTQGICNLLPDRHQHRTIIEQEVLAQDNPIPANAVEIVQTFAALDPQSLPIAVPANHLAGEFITEVAYENNAPQPTLRYEYEGSILVPITHRVQGNHHIYTKKRPAFFPINNSPIPRNAFAFHQHICFARTDSVDTAQPITSQGTSAASFSKEKAVEAPKTAIEHLREKSIPKGTSQIRLPAGWEAFLSPEEQQAYLQDLLLCYENGSGARIKEMATRHNLRPEAIRGLLLLKLDKIRTCTEELSYSKSKKKRKPLPTLTLEPLKDLLSKRKENKDKQKKKTSAQKAKLSFTSENTSSTTATTLRLSTNVAAQTESGSSTPKRLRLTLQAPKTAEHTSASTDQQG